MPVLIFFYRRGLWFAADFIFNLFDFSIVHRINFLVSTTFFYFLWVAYLLLITFFKVKNWILLTSFFLFSFVIDSIKTFCKKTKLQKTFLVDFLWNLSVCTNKTHSEPSFPLLFAFCSVCFHNSLSLLQWIIKKFFFNNFHYIKYSAAKMTEFDHCKSYFPFKW